MYFQTYFLVQIGLTLFISSQSQTVLETFFVLGFSSSLSSSTFPSSSSSSSFFSSGSSLASSSSSSIGSSTSSVYNSKICSHCYNKSVKTLIRNQATCENCFQWVQRIFFQTLFLVQAMCLPQIKPSSW